ncbi:MAG: hypothetical protein L0Z62_33490, partial [Gemmataceae bacterium]|nr:hypothetical protein [Gemmataceae bacterium]
RLYPLGERQPKGDTTENRGTVSITGSRFHTEGGFLAGGTFQLPNSSWDLELDGGVPATLDGVTISQGNAWASSSDGVRTLSVVGTNTISAGATFRQSSTTNLAGSGTINVHGLYTWDGGQWDGLDGTAQLHVFPNANLTIGSPNPLDPAPTAPHAMINGWTLYNEGTVTWHRSNITIGGLTQPSETIVNYGIFDIRSNHSIVFNPGGEPLAFYNYGTLKKTDGGGVSTIDMALFNSGTFQQQSGRINFTYPFTQAAPGQAFLNGNVIGAPLFVFEGGSVSLDGGTIEASLGVQVAAGASVSGGGTIIGNVTTAGQWTVGSGTTLNISENYTQTAGTTQVGSGTLTVNGQLLVNGGSVSLAGGAIASSAGMEIAAGATLLGFGSITTPQLVNSGTIDIAGLGGYGVATLYVYGNYQQTASGLLIIDLAADGTCDTLAIEGGGQAGGTLRARWLDGPPQGSTTYQVVAVLWAIPPVDPFFLDLPPGVTAQPLPTGINLIYTP